MSAFHHFFCQPLSNQFLLCWTCEENFRMDQLLNGTRGRAVNDHEIWVVPMHTLGNYCLNLRNHSYSKFHTIFKASSNQTSKYMYIYIYVNMYNIYVYMLTAKLNVRQDVLQLPAVQTPKHYFQVKSPVEFIIKTTSLAWFIYPASK